MINKKKKIKISLRLINNILLVLAIAGGVYFVAGANNLSIKGFELRELKKQISDADYSNRSLESKMMALESHNNLSQKVGELSMVPVEKIEYLSGTAMVVAKR